PGSVTNLPPPQVAVSLPDTSSPETSTIAIPLTIGDITGLGVTSCDMEIQYNKFMLHAEDVILDGTIAEDWIASIHYKIGAVVISMNGETPLEGSGPLSRLLFRVSGKAGDLSTLHFKNFQFNAGIPVALTRDGSLRVSALPPEQISVSIADTTVRSGARLAIPIKISSLDNVKIYNYRIQLDFDGQVLNFIKVDTTETISSLWSPPSVMKLDNSITITAFGTEALSGAGKLINLIFDVIGFDGTVSELRFANMSVSASSVELILQNGIVFVEGVIPVELSSFSVISDRDQIHLSWTTESELNNYGFDVQRKTSSKPEWQSIGFISGAGTTALPQFYQYTDRKLSPGQYFYRLKQIDFDGEFAFSAAMSGQISAPEFMVLHQNYPNPFNAATVIEYEIPENINRVTAVIYNILGQPIRRLMDNASLESGVHQLVWDGVDDSCNQV
ncbi:MAG: cohesin domain-containing protein, partial [bacterium]|nr:cohesin domain-containing protein [bacterium]